MVNEVCLGPPAPKMLCKVADTRTNLLSSVQAWPLLTPLRRQMTEPHILLGFIQHPMDSTPQAGFPPKMAKLPLTPGPPIEVGI